MRLPARLGVILASSALVLLVAGAAGALDTAVLAKDIAPGNEHSRPAKLTDGGTALFFSAEEGPGFTSDFHGREPWRSDGTEAGTSIVKDIQPGSSSSHSQPASFTLAGGQVFFSAHEESTGRELYASDGTPAGTYLVEDIAGGTASSLAPDETRHYAVLNGIVYFIAATVDGWELWRSDGTAPGTYMVKDICPGSCSGLPLREDLGVYNGKVYFGAKPTGSGNLELWSSDGTEPGTQLVKSADLGGDGVAGRHYTLFDGHLYFAASPGPQGSALWRTDGTTLGTTEVGPLTGMQPAFVRELEVANDQLFFVANGESLWVTDGTALGTVEVKVFAATPVGLTDLNGLVYFLVDDGSPGYDLWRSDGTNAGTVPVHHFPAPPPGPAPGIARAATLAPDGFGLTSAGAIYFGGYDATYGYEPMKIDSSSMVTVLADVNPGLASSGPSLFTSSNGRVFFVAGRSGVGIELFSLPLTPTAVSVTSFTARRSPQRTTVRWRTATELGTLGFNVYRGRGSGYVRVNRKLIRAAGTTRGRSYTFRADGRARLYWLEEVRADAKNRWHGPATAR